MAKLSLEERQRIFDEENQKRRRRNEQLFQEAMLLIIDSKVKIAEATMLIEPYTKALKVSQDMHLN